MANKDPFNAGYNEPTQEPGVSIVYDTESEGENGTGKVKRRIWDQTPDDADRTASAFSQTTERVLVPPSDPLAAVSDAISWITFTGLWGILVKIVAGTLAAGFLAKLAIGSVLLLPIWVLAGICFISPNGYAYYRAALCTFALILVLL